MQKLFRICFSLLFLTAQSLVIRLRHGRADILYLIANPAPYGGAELQFRILIEQLKERGQRPIALTSGILEKGKAHPLIQQLAGAKVSHLHLGDLGQTNFQLACVRALAVSWLFRILGGEIFHFFKPTAAPFAVAARLAHLRVIYTEAAMARPVPHWQPLIPNLKEIDYIFSVSAEGLRGLKKYFDYKGPAQVVLPFVDPPPPGILARPPQQDDFHVLYFGRFDAGKNVSCLIRAFSTLKVQIPQSRLTLVGDGPTREALLTLLLQLDLGACSQVTGWLEGSSLYAQLATADAVCLPSLHEGSPCSLLEAMQIGLPIVASAVGGIPDMLKDGVSGLLFPPGDEHTLARHLLTLARNPELRVRLGTKARESSPMMTQQKNLQLFFTIYDSFGVKAPNLSLLRVRQ